MAPGLEHFKRLVGMHAAADEIFWPTLVLNIPNFTQQVSKQHWFVRWTSGSTSHSPELITDLHLQEIMEHRDMFLFVRKVEEEASATLLHELDVASLAEETDVAAQAAPPA